MADKQQQCTAYVCGDVVARGDVVVLVEMWWLCGDVVAHVEMWWLMWRCGGSLVARQTSEAEVPVSNPASPTLILGRCRIIV